MSLESLSFFLARGEGDSHDASRESPEIVAPRPDAKRRACGSRTSLTIGSVQMVDVAAKA